MTLTVDDVERVAQRAAELMRDELAALLGPPALAGGAGLVDATAAAAALGVSRKFIYSRAVELGGRRVAGGPWRFDLSLALAANTQSPAPSLVVRRPRPIRQPLSQGSVPLLPLRGNVVDGR
jgi:hypothetical protein